MTVTSEVSRSGPYNGNGATTVFPYEFKIFAAADLLVTQVSVAGVETTLVLNTDYTVSGVLSDSGGNVTLTTALPGDGTTANSQKLTIRRVLDVTQTMDLRSQGKISAEVLERAHDRAIMLIQQLEDERARSLRLVESETGTDLLTLLPSFADRKGKNLSFDPTTAQPTATSPASAAVSVAMQPVAASATLALAKSAMGTGTHYISVTDAPYNAVGDGTTDDTSAIQSALNSGKAVVIPQTSGYFKVTSTLTMTSPEQVLLVLGRVKLVTASTSTDLLVASGTHQRIHGPGVLEGPGVYKDNTVGVSIASLIRVQGKGSTVEGVELREPIESGLTLDTVDSCSVRGVRVVGGIGAYGSSQHYGILAYTCNDLTIQGCHFEPSAGGGAVVQAINTVSCARVSISGCVARGCWEKLLYGQGTDMSVVGNEFTGITGNQGDCLRVIGDRNVVVGNVVSGGAKGGITCFNGSDCVIADNTITDCQNNGIQVSHYGGSSVELSRNIIEGNVIRMKAYTGTESIYSGIEYSTASAVDCRNISIKNNQIFDADRSGVNRGGIYILPLAGSLFWDVEIEGNKVYNCGYEGIDMSRVRRGSVSRNKIIAAGYSFAPINGILLATTVSEVVLESNDVVMLHDRRNSSWRWQLSASGTNEYYLQTAAGANPSVPQPRAVFAGLARLTAGAVGTLAAGSWAWGNNDSLGYSTIYVRLSDGTDPDTKSVGHVLASHADYPILLTAAASTTNNRILSNRCPGAAVGHAYFDSATDLNESRDNSIGWYPLVGTITVPAGSGNIDTTNDNVVNSNACRITLNAIGQLAATIDAGTKMAFVVSKTSYGSFRVQTQDGTTFGAAGVYSYRIDQ